MTDPRLAALQAIITDEWPCTCPDAYTDRQLAAPGCPALAHPGSDNTELRQFLAATLDALDDALLLTADSPEPGTGAVILDDNGRPWRHTPMPELSTHEEYTRPWRSTDGTGSTWAGLFTRERATVRLVEPSHDQT